MDEWSEKMGEYKYKIEFELEQQTPMLHFQHDQTGATLRASEWSVLSEVVVG